MLLGIYLQCRWSGYQCNFDIAYPMFATVVDKLEGIIGEETLVQADETSANAFSIGIGTIAPLFYVAIMCREPTIRRRATALLAKCPSQDGPWSARLAQIVSNAMIDYEERKAREEGVGYTLTSYIPENCRICYYYYYHNNIDEAKQERGGTLRVFRRSANTDMVYTHEDIDLGQLT